MVTSPLIAVSDVASEPLSCGWCLRAAGAFLSGGVACAGAAAGCEVVYCSPACAASAASAGAHALLCGGMRELDAFCTSRNANFPRAAAQMLAASLVGSSGGRSFTDYWGAVGALVTHPVPADAAALPAVWREGHALVVGALSRRMDAAGAAAFFATAFDVRTYARLMGTLRLNSFALELPLGSTLPPALAVAVQPRPGSKETPTTAAAASCASGGDASACGESGGSSAEGCCSAEDEGAAAAAAGGEPRGGTALFPEPISFVNHDCEPNLAVLIGPEGHLALTARRAVAAGEELTITYLDSSAPVHARRGKLLHGYGFECACARCTAQLAEDRAARGAAARATRRVEQEAAAAAAPR